MTKKILFSDKHGLTQAVLQGRKTMTRRRADVRWAAGDVHDIPVPNLEVGEVLAVAQSYKNIGYTKEWVEQHISPNPNAKPTDPFEKKYPGWNNKMFVRADLMPHQIRITDYKVERLHEISEEDALKEGIYGEEVLDAKLDLCYAYTFYPALRHYDTAREAFSHLIDKVSGKGTWECNPWVFAYTFELMPRRRTYNN